MSTTPYRRTGAGVRTADGDSVVQPPNFTGSPPPNRTSADAAAAMPVTPKFAQFATGGGAHGQSDAAAPSYQQHQPSALTTPRASTTAAPADGFLTPINAERPLTSREPPGSLAILHATPMVLEPEPEPTAESLRTSRLYSSWKAAKPSSSTVPARAATDARIKALPPTAPVPTSTTAQISAPVSTVKAGESSSEPSLTGDRRQSYSSNDNSLAEGLNLPQPAAPAAQPTTGMLQQKPPHTLPPLAPGAAPQQPPMMPFFPFGAPMMGPPGSQGGFQPYPPFPIPVQIISYGPPFGMLPPGMPPMQPMHPTQPAPTMPAPVNPPVNPPPAPPAPTPLASPGPRASPRSILSSPSSKFPPQTPRFPSSPYMGRPAAFVSRPAPPEERPSTPLANKLRSLDSELTMTEVELAAEKRQERDLTMFWLWLLCALAMVTMAFHLHRFSYDRVLYSPFASAGLALNVIGFVLIVCPILLIFIGRTIYERLPTALLFHAFMCFLVSFILYIPILATYLPHSPDSAFVIELAAASTRFSSSRSILAALVLHAITIAVFYFLLMRVLSGERRRDEGIMGSERAELHAALVAMQNFSAERARSDQQMLALRKALQASEDKHTTLESDKNRELIAAGVRLKLAAEERDQLSAIMDGLDQNKALDSRQASMYREQVAHIIANHNAEVRKLVGELESRQKFSLSLQKELAIHQDQLVLERNRAKACETELAIIKLQMANQGLEQSRIIGLQERLDLVQEEYNRNFTALQKAEAQLMLAKEGKCIHCESVKEKYEHLRNQHLAQSKTQEENAQLRQALAAIKQQLAATHKRNLQLEQRTRKKVEQIERNLDDFDPNEFAPEE